jgi:hypothetical protein
LPPRASANPNILRVQGLASFKQGPAWRGAQAVLALWLQAAWCARARCKASRHAHASKWVDLDNEGRVVRPPARHWTHRCASLRLYSSRYTSKMIFQSREAPRLDTSSTGGDGAGAKLMCTHSASPDCVCQRVAALLSIGAGQRAARAEPRAYRARAHGAREHELVKGRALVGAAPVPPQHPSPFLSPLPPPFYPAHPLVSDCCPGDLHHWGGVRLFGHHHIGKVAACGSLLRGSRRHERRREPRGRLPRKRQVRRHLWHDLLAGFGDLLPGVQNLLAHIFCRAARAVVASDAARRSLRV